MNFFLLDTQQLTLGPITNNNSDNSKTVSNLGSIDDEIFSKFPVTIKDAIWAVYLKNEKKKILNALNTNQRILEFFLYQKQS